MTHPWPLPVVRWLWRHHRWLLAGLWVLVQVAFLLKFHGPHLAHDSERYLDYAQNIAYKGSFEQGHNRRYILYPLFESLFFRLGWGVWGIVVGQLVLAGWAAAAFYHAIHDLAPGRRQASAVLATTMFVLWPETQQFNTYLLTESLFMSLSVLSLAAVVAMRHGGWLRLGRLLVVLVMCAFARPNGFVLAAAAGLAGFAALRRRPVRWPLWLVLAAAVALAPLGYRLLNYQLATYTLIETYERGDLIFLVKDWSVHSHSPLDLPPTGLSPVERLLYFYWHNPQIGLRLMVGKLFVFISGLKPHYSWLHRLTAVSVLWPCYWLAVRAARLRQVWLPGRVFLAAVPLLQAAVVMLTVDDYDVRFLAPVLPFVFALAALAVGNWLGRRRAAGPAAAQA